MAKTGPKPIPTALMALHGERTMYRRKNEPKLSTGLPEIPDWLPEEAKADWFRVAKLLLDHKLVTKVDGEMLGRYCGYLLAWRVNYALWKQGGFAGTYALKDDNGKVKCLQVSPLMSVINRLEDKLRRIEDAFGLSPSARAGLIKNEDDSDSKDKSRFFNWASGA
jgi:P27 family predicted phage terminase small subunit